MVSVSQKDTTWSVVVAISCCIGNFLAVGLSYSTGVYYVVFRETFQVSPSTVSWISSINLGCTCTFGPLVSISVMKLGSRMTMFIGAMLTSLGLVLSAFVTNVYCLYVTFGVMTGAGVGFVYQTACATVPMYFEKYRSVALGFVSAASAVGQFVYPFVIPPLVDHFGWRGSLLIVSGMLLHVCIAAMVLEPNTRYRLTHDQTKSEQGQSTEEMQTPEEIEKRKGKIEEVEQESMLRISKELLCDLRFNILSLLTFLYMAGSSVAFSYLAGYAKTMGIEEKKADLFLSLVGGFSLAGRIILGMVGQITWINIVTLLAVTFGLTGVGMIIAAISPTFIGCLICSAMFGFFYAASGPVYFEVLCRLFETKRFTVAVGYGMFIRGAGITVGAPLAGLVYEASSSFPAAFYFGGSLCVASGLQGMVLYLVNIHKTKS